MPYSDEINSLRAELRQKGLEVYRVAIAQEDGTADELEFVPFGACMNAYSVAKTFTMTAIGLLHDRGMLRLDERVCDILPEMARPDMDERWHMCTVEMALAHRLGLPAGFLDIDAAPAQQFGRDYLGYMLSRPLEYDPGTDSRYSDGAYYLLSLVVERRAGMPLDDFLWRELFFPMGFQEAAWSRCPMGHPMGATGLYISARDMAKLGVLYLCGGDFMGRRLLSEEWVELAKARRFALDPDKTGKIWRKGGMFGQSLTIDCMRRIAVAVQAHKCRPESGPLGAMY